MVPSRFWFPVLLLGMAWCQELVDQLLFGGQWNLPMGPGLPIWGVITAPFSHSGFAHLISNSVVFLPLSWLAEGQARATGMLTMITAAQTAR